MIKIIDGGQGTGCFGKVSRPDHVLILTKQPIKSVVTGEIFPADILLRVDPFSGEQVCAEGLAKRMTIQDLVNLNKPTNENRRNVLISALKGAGEIYEEKS